MQNRTDPSFDHADSTNNQNESTRDDWDLDAFGTTARLPGVQDQVQDVPTQKRPAVPKRNPGFLSARDESLLRHLVCLRLLSYSQLHRLIFSTVDPSFARRRIRQLARDGWLNTWEPPSKTGGHVRFAHPTQRALHHVLPAFETSQPWGKIIRLMLPRTKRRPLQLAGATVPKWLPHQREVNELLLSIQKARRSGILWASSWDSPFPPRLGMFGSPQPDYVLIEEVDGQPQLVFGEHDRASEPIEKFVARKITLYLALARFPEACERHFGVRHFRVQVTVTDPHRAAPTRRLRELIDATRRHAGTDIFHFTLGGWLHACPDDPIWFGVGNAPTNDSVAVLEHPQTRSLRAAVLPATM